MNKSKHHNIQCDYKRVRERCMGSGSGSCGCVLSAFCQGRPVAVKLPASRRSRPAMKDLAQRCNEIRIPRQLRHRTLSSCLAPEAIRSETQLACAADVFSFGRLLYGIAMGRDGILHLNHIGHAHAVPLRDEPEGAAGDGR